MKKLLAFCLFCLVIGYWASNSSKKESNVKISGGSTNIQNSPLGSNSKLPRKSLASKGHAKEIKDSQAKGFKEGGLPHNRRLVNSQNVRPTGNSSIINKNIQLPELMAELPYQVKGALQEVLRNHPDQIDEVFNKSSEINRPLTNHGNITGKLYLIDPENQSESEISIDIENSQIEKDFDDNDNPIMQNQTVISFDGEEVESKLSGGTDIVLKKGSNDFIFVKNLNRFSQFFVGAYYQEGKFTGLVHLTKQQQTNHAY